MHYTRSYWRGFWFKSEFIGRSVHTRLLVSTCSGYDLASLFDTQTDRFWPVILLAQPAELKLFLIYILSFVLYIYCSPKVLFPIFWMPQMMLLNDVNWIHRSISTLESSSQIAFVRDESRNTVCGTMSASRRTFCLLVTFDLILTFILWAVYVKVSNCC